MNMPQQADPLAQLRDIHLPAAVSAWPPAPGWWALGLLLLVAVVALLLYLLQRYRSNRYRRLALKQLATLETQLPQPTNYLQALNQLLKRTALAAPKPAQVAGLTGQPWLHFLDQSGATDTFSRGPGRLLLEGPYTPQPQDVQEQQLQQLHDAARRWIRKHRVNRMQAPC